MHHYIHFSVTGLNKQEKINKLREAALGIKGAKDIRFMGRDKVRVTYDPTKVIPSLLISTMSSYGIKAHKG